MRKLGLILAPLLSLLTIAAGQEEPMSVTLRVMTYNIHHGEGYDEKIDLWRLADVIKKQKPDLVAVQEVDVKTRRAERTHQASKLAELTGLHFVFGKFMDYSGGEYGQAVMSRFPINSSENHPLPPGPEPRTALEIRVDVPFPDETTRELVFVGNHLYATERQRLAQAKRITEIYKDETAPVILAGDFNSEPAELPMLLLAKRWVDPTLEVNTLTWPSRDPRVEIDYVLYSPQEAFDFVSSDVIAEEDASDHRPVVTVLKFKGGD